MNKYASFSRKAKVIRRYNRSCATKVKYVTFEEAAANLYHQTPYRCQFCDGWHLTGAVHKTIGICRRFAKQKS